MKLLSTIGSTLIFFLRVIAFVLVFVISLNLALTLVISPVYDFPEPQSFSGSKWYNPYRSVSGDDWKLSNFQIQSAAWGGVTNGQNNPSERIFDVYDRLGYDLITISDYMSINPYHSEGHAFVPVYEHGYGVRKTHQVCIGAREVLPLDYPLLQTLNAKQFILEQLSHGSDLVAIAHPSVRNAYTHNDLAYLTNYDLIEALSNFQHSISHWDAALSNGKPVFLLANDDTHNLDNPFDYGKVATLIHTNSLETDSVVDALKAGRAYGITVHCPDHENHELKVERFKDLPELRSLELRGDSLVVMADRTISEARFVSNGGKVIHSAGSSEALVFVMPDTAQYVRVELDFEPGHTIYTNPVIRSSDGEKPIMATARINWPATILYRLFFFGLVLAGVIFIFVRNRKYLIPRWQPLPPRKPSASEGRF